MRIAYSQWKSVRASRGIRKILRHGRDVWPPEESILQPGDYERDDDNDYQCPDKGGLNPQAKSSIIGIVNRLVESVESNHDCAFDFDSGARRIGYERIIVNSILNFVRAFKE